MVHGGRIPLIPIHVNQLLASPMPPPPRPYTCDVCARRVTINCTRAYPILSHAKCKPVKQAYASACRMHLHLAGDFNMKYLIITAMLFSLNTLRGLNEYGYNCVYVAQTKEFDNSDGY